MLPAWFFTVMWIIIFIVGTITIIGSIIFLVWKIKQWLLYREFLVFSFEEDSFGQVHGKIDRAGIFLKKKDKKLWLKRAKYGLDFQKLKYVSAEKEKIVLLFKKHGSDPHFLDLKVNAAKGTVDFGLTEEDLNWGLNMYDVSKNQFEWKNKILQYAPWAGLVFVGMIMTILFIVMMNKLDVLQGLPDLTNSLKDAALNIANAKTGTTVIQ